jgi:sporulation protein YlmC with PRC-barrel domain
MLHRVKTLKGYKLDSLDGEMGKVKDFYFDDQHWTVRYLVADTGNWLTGRQVLISPYALVAAIKEENHIAVDLTRKQIEDSPSLASDKPVSRQFEEAYYAHYGWPSYWVGPYPWGRAAYPARVGGPPAQPSQPEKEWDPHLRSTGALIGYHIQAADGEIGHVEDFVIDDETWTIRYLIVDTRNWWPGKMVLVSPRWIDRVGWNESKVFIKLTRETIQQSPEYSEESLITRDYETALHGHYHLEGYWVEGESDSPRNAP